MRVPWIYAVATLAIWCGTAPARAGFISAPDVVLYCNPDIAHACEAVGAEFRARTGVPVRVLSAPAVQQLALIERGTRSDVLMTLASQMDLAAARHLLDPQSRYGAWRDALVLGGRGLPTATQPLAADAEAALQGTGKLALVDPTEAGSLDGPALIERLGWHLAATAGAADGREIAWMLSHYAARLGVLQRSALLAEPSLQVVAPIAADAYAPIVYSAAVTHSALSRYAVAFLDFLKTPAAGTVLAGAGLETAQ